MKSNNLKKMPVVWVLAIAAVGMLGLSSAVFAADDVPASFTLAQADSAEEAEPVAAADGGSGCPVSLSLAYSLYSDYIWRGVNLSEYAGEGREKPNHQVAVDVGFDLGELGTLTYRAWFEWYADQKKLTGDGANIQEIDHTIAWGHALTDNTDLTVGMTFYTYPNNKANSPYTIEYFVLLEHDDSWLWGTEDPVLNPSFFMAHDVDALGGVWMEFAVNHPFELCENLTLTPGWMVAVDACYWRDNTTRFAGDEWSLVLEYDLASALQLPESAGSLTLAGELYYWNAWGNFAGEGTSNDELWGGMTVAWGWGG